MNDLQKLYNDYNIVVEPYICSFHKEKPGEYFSGCACCSGFGMFPKDHEKFAQENKPKPFDASDELFVSDV